MDIEEITRDTFQKMPVENKLDILFDLLVMLKHMEVCRGDACTINLATCRRRFVRLEIATAVVLFLLLLLIGWDDSLQTLLSHLFKAVL